MFNPQPKSLPKPKKEFGFKYWNEIKKKSLEKKKMKIKPIQERDEVFYKYIWNIRHHECTNCGNQITEPKKHNFHHILPKARYPYFRHEEKNIIVLCWSCHQKVESAISYPKQPVYPLCEKQKRSLLATVGIDYKII